jgi:hypothetical protein
LERTNLRSKPSKPEGWAVSPLAVENARNDGKRLGAVEAQVRACQVFGAAGGTYRSLGCQQDPTILAFESGLAVEN